MPNIEYNSSESYSNTARSSIHIILIQSYRDTILTPLGLKSEKATKKCDDGSIDTRSNAGRLAEGKYLYRCSCIIGHLPYIKRLDTFCRGVPTLLLAFLVGSFDTNGNILGRWHGPFPRDNEQIVASWTNALRAYEGKSSELAPPGPRSREPVQWHGTSPCDNEGAHKKRQQ